MASARIKPPARPRTLTVRLSPGLAKPVEAALDSLQSLQEAVQKAKPKHPAAAIRHADAIKADLKDALAQVRGAKPDKDEAAAMDAAVVAIAAALRSADLVSQGLQDEDDDQLQTGVKLSALAQADLKRLDARRATPWPRPAARRRASIRSRPSLGGDVVPGQPGQQHQHERGSFLLLPGVSQASDVGDGRHLIGELQQRRRDSSTSSGLGCQGPECFRPLSLPAALRQGALDRPLRWA